MIKGMIITCPKHDDATEYLAYYSREILEEAKTKNLKVKEVIPNKSFNLASFSDIIKSIDYQLVIFNGHGSPDSIFGYKDNIIVKAGENANLLKERIIYARACEAGLVLGKECMKNTENGCFIGYNLPFVFYLDQTWSANPHNDNTARLFLIPSNSVPISLIKGNTCINAHNSSREKILKNINKLLTGRLEPDTIFLVEGLWNNYMGQVIIGNESAMLS
ncbi:MAG: hypothetical protein V1886_00070 [archaeon]